MTTRVTPRPTLRLGLAGFGQLARKYYVPALRALNGVNISIVADPLDASRAAACAAFPGVVTLSDPGSLFAERLDGVLVASPPSTHLAMWNRAATAGIPILLEKPFTLRGELPSAANGAGERRLLMLDLNRRFWPPYQKMRKLARAGIVGDVESVDIYLHVDIRPWCSVTSHRLQSTEGGVLYDLGSQAVDLARWIVGSEPRNVSASSINELRGDHVMVDLEFEGGVRAHCDLAYTEPAGERVAIKGRHGEILLSDPNMAVRLRKLHQSDRTIFSYARDLAVFGYRGLRRSHSMMRYSVAAALAAFTESIRRDLPFCPGYEDATANATWLDAAARAMELGTRIDRGTPDVSTQRV